MKTTTLKKSEIEKKWWIADAEGQILGRLASKIAQILRGKHKTNFSPHLDMEILSLLSMLTKYPYQETKRKKKCILDTPGFQVV